MKKWTIISVAVLFALGLTAPGWAYGPDELEVNNNDLVGATTGGTAANDHSIAVGEAEVNKNASTNTETETVTGTKTDTDTQTATTSFNDTDTKTLKEKKTDNS